MKTYVVVDSNNHWLAYGAFASPEAALATAKKATEPAYDPTAEVFVYEISGETRFTPKKDKED